MGDAAGEEKKALRITATDGDGASTRTFVPPAEQRRPAPSVPAAAGVAAIADGSAAVQSCGEDDGGDDEQVERFYALLANIRALRGLFSAGDGAGGSGPPAGRGRKRAREADAPWRPAFRMEDFEEEVSHGTADARCAVRKQGASGGGAKRPAVGAARGKAAAADDHEEDDVAEARGRKIGRRVAAQG